MKNVLALATLLIVLPASYATGGWDGAGNVNRTNGVFSGTQVWQNSRDAGRKIRADDMDTHDQDIADAIEKALNLDGENSPTTNIPWGSNRITGLATGTAATDAATVLQAELLPRGYIDGCVMSNDTDADHDISISVCASIDSTNARNLVSSSAIVKQIDAAFVQGTNAGGMFTGSVGADTWYYMCQIEKDSDDSIGFGFDASSTCANVPTGWTEFRRIGAVLTDVSSNIIAFFQEDDHFYWDIPVNDENNTGGITTTENLVNMTAPPLEEIKAKFSCNFFDSTASAPTYILVRPTRVADTVPSVTLSNMATRITGGGNDHESATFEMHVDSSGRIAYRASASTADHDFRITTYGWVDPRGKE